MPIKWIFRFLQWCGWDNRSSRMWHIVKS